MWSKSLGPKGGNYLRYNDSPLNIKVSYCVTVYNRSLLKGREYLPRLVETLREDSPAESELIVTDWQSTDLPLLNWLPQAWDKSLQIIEMDGKFSAAWGRTTACERANGNFVFALDADMLVPKGYTKTIIGYLKGGYKTAFPLYYIEESDGVISPSPEQVANFKKNNDPANRGHGNYAFPKTLWPKLRMAYGDSLTRTSWGGEDHEIFWVSCALGDCWRDWIPGFIHQWHSKEGSFYG